MLDNELQWISDAQKGNSQSFSKLVESYQKPVYNLCYRMLGNAEDAEDAAQETFIRAFKSIKRYDPNRPFSTWLLSIAAHYCIDQIRRRRLQVISVEDLTIPNLPDQSPGVEDSLSTKEENSRIREVLNVLDAKDRAAVIMFYWYDFSYLEISDALSLTPSAIKSRLHRSRRAMAKEWQKRQAHKIEALRESGFGESLMQERITP